MSEALLTLLKWCMLGLVYLFFFSVLQVTWWGSTTNVAVRRVSGRRSPEDDREHHKASGVVPTMVVLEPAAMTGTRFEISGETTIGRAAGCQINLDDTYLSQLHARVTPTDSGVLVEDLGSTNGTFLNRHRVTAPAMAAVGDQLQLGGIVLEFH